MAVRSQRNRKNGHRRRGSRKNVCPNLENRIGCHPEHFPTINYKFFQGETTAICKKYQSWEILVAFGIKEQHITLVQHNVLNYDVSYRIKGYKYKLYKFRIRFASLKIAKYKAFRIQAVQQ